MQARLTVNWMLATFALLQWNDNNIVWESKMGRQSPIRIVSIWYTFWNWDYQKSTTNLFLQSNHISGWKLNLKMWKTILHWWWCYVIYVICCCRFKFNLTHESQEQNQLKNSEKKSFRQKRDFMDGKLNLFCQRNALFSGQLRKEAGMVEFLVFGHDSWMHCSVYVKSEIA